MHVIVDLPPGAVGLVWEGTGGEGANVLGTPLHPRHRVRSSCTRLLSPQEQTEVRISPPCVRTGGVKELFSWMLLTGRFSVPHSKASPSRPLCAGLEG